MSNYPYSRDNWPDCGKVSVKVTLGPSAEPITSDDLLAQIRVDWSGDNQSSLLPRKITAAREFAENFCNRTFPVQTLQMTLDRFPLEKRWIDLLRAPVVSVLAVYYYDTNGQQQTLDSSQYLEDLDLAAPRIALAPNCNWPSVQDRVGAVWISYVAGYSSVPAAVQEFILLYAADLWFNRTSQTEKALTPNPQTLAMLYPFRTF